MLFEGYCKNKGIEFENVNSVSPYEDSTLFCPAGMQKYKGEFKDLSIIGKTICNIQPCIRLNDMEEIGDGTHLLYFNMIGLFSFRGMTVKQTIDFWVEFITQTLKLELDYVTIHPDKMEDWINYYDSVEVRPDEECIWSDGEMGGYCTEFYVDGIEIGNIVNTNGDSIDVGFGYERLEQLYFKTQPKSRGDVLKETTLKIIDSGYRPSHNGQGYVLKKLLRTLVLEGLEIEHEYFYSEKTRQEKLVLRYNKLKDKHKGKSKEWWFDTHGIDLDLM